MKKVVLIADNAEQIRDLMSTALVNAGYRVIENIDGVEALDQLDGKMINLIITDLHMPDKDCITLIKEIRASTEYSYVPILSLTKGSKDNKKREAKTAGANSWTSKPFLQERFLEVVKRTAR